MQFFISIFGKILGFNFPDNINVRGVLNFSAKSIRRRICHVKAYAWNVNFSAFAIEELFRIKACQWRQNALKFKFRCTKIYVLTRDQYIFGQNKFKLVITCQRVNFSAFWRHWQALVRNNSSIANALKFTFHAYAFTWQILIRILFTLKFKTPVASGTWSKILNGLLFYERIDFSIKKILWHRPLSSLGGGQFSRTLFLKWNVSFGIWFWFAHAQSDRYFSIEEKYQSVSFYPVKPRSIPRDFVN